MASIAFGLLLTMTIESWGTLARAESTDNTLQNIEKIVDPAPKEAPNFDKEVLLPLRAKQAEEARVAEEQAKQSEQVAEELVQQEAAKQRPPVEQVVFQPPQPVIPAREVQQGEQSLIGSLGYAIPYGNCVNEPGVNNPGWGNPINWPVTSNSPWIGASALFYYNHVAVVTGVWSNGDIEVRHQNFTGGQHRFPRSAFRGFR